MLEISENGGVPITSDQHPDFIWTWKSNDRSSKASLWIPYFYKAEKVSRKKLWIIGYNGGDIEVDLSKVDLIMFYGATGELPLTFLDDAAKNGVILLIHRRNITAPYVFYSPSIGDDKDILGKQIAIRNHSQKKVYIAKVLIRERFHKMQGTIDIPKSLFNKLAAAKTLAEVRNIEAYTTARFWDAWYEALGVESHRRETHPLKSALDAGSKFMFGVILRWVLFHQLSAKHGFLHEPTAYPSLIYDLMEPYRYIIENSVFTAWSSSDPKPDEKVLIEKTLNILKVSLDEACFVPATRQVVRRKNLLHGIALSLRAYLLGEMKKFVIPTEGAPNGGRPPAVSYKLPGTIYNADVKRFKKEEGKKEEAGGF